MNKLIRSLVFIAASCWFLFGISSLAQEKKEQDFKIKIIEGKKYYVHIVAKGETLYGISKLYGVVIKEIVFENPLTINGLNVGGTIKIPVPIRIVDPKVMDGKYIYHNIQLGETMYSLSRQYNISAETIDMANPELVGGLIAGNTIRIPVLKKISSRPELLKEILESVDSNSVAFSDSIVTDSLSAQPRDSMVFKDVYQLVFMLPLYLNKNDSLDKKREVDEPLKIYEKSKIGLEFYEGALIAVDSMRKQGLSANIRTYDTSNDTSEVIEILKDKKLLNSDIIIGPLYRSNMIFVNEYAKEKGIHMVSPLVATNRILIGNEHISKVKPCVQTNVEEIASYIATQYCADNNMAQDVQNVIVVHNGDPGEIMLSELFKEKYYEEVRKNTDSSKTTFATKDLKLVNYIEREMTAIEEVLSVADSNVLVILSRDQVFISKIIARLNSKHDDYSMAVFGLPVWKHFKNIEVAQLHNLNVHIAYPEYINYESEEVKKFVKKFVNKYDGYPSSYSFQGFDVTYFYLNMLRNYGYQFASYLPEVSLASLQTYNDYQKIGMGSGYENKSVFILKYEDYVLVPKFSGTPR
ncbi:MAG TPA: LysM peptidoglycan-binding domain-containing protein [Flavobacteriales bacterium]|nr:LysM peptidoglycan-binding domain-containing protein [Flavobacteriales bacterium]